MDLHTLSYFKKVADYQHITRAAQALHVAQPALSRTISQLEQELDVLLFDRTGRNITLNQYGDIVLRHANRIFQEIHDMEEEIKSAKNKPRQKISVALYAASKMFPDLFIEFKKSYPETYFFAFQEGEEAGNVEADFTITSSTQATDTETSVTLFREEVLMAFPKWHRLSQCSSVKLRELGDSPFIRLRKGKNLRTIMDSYCRLVDFTPNAVMETDNPDTVRNLIGMGLGVGFIPSISWWGMENPNIVMVPISDPNCYRYVNLSWRPDDCLSTSALLFREFLLDYFRDYPT